jgi:D-erythro-7,8-dihydroneopterin triphosphate epimerase
MTDTIFIKDLLVRTVLGVTDDERREKQDVLISIAMETGTSAPAKSDNLADAINYRTIAKQILALTETSQFQLVERLAEEIAALCLKESRVQRVRVTVEKPGAVRFARTVGVTIERGAGGA